MQVIRNQNEMTINDASTFNGTLYSNKKHAFRQYLMTWKNSQGVLPSKI